MFFKYSIKSKGIKSELLNNRCSSCKSQFALRLSVWQKYLVLYWIPFIPLKKFGSVKCESCHDDFEIVDFPESVGYSYQDLKRKSRTPWWTFSGLFVLFALILLFINFLNLRARNNEAYLNSPHVNDVYEIKLESREYTLYKVVKVDEKNVYYKAHQYIVERSKHLNSMHDDGEEFYQPEIHEISKKELHRLYESGILRRVIRE
jgi:hypothetical protein